MNRLTVIGIAITLFAMCGCGEQSLKRSIPENRIPQKELSGEKKIERHQEIKSREKEFAASKSADVKPVPQAKANNSACCVPRIQQPAVTTPWQLLQKDQPWMEHLWGVAVVGNAPGYILLRTNSGIFLSMDEGNTWKPASNGLKDTQVSELVSSHGDNRIAFAGARKLKGLYKTVDGGRTWHFSGKGLPTSRLTSALWMNPNNHQHLMVFYDYLYQSTDGGKTWQRKGTSLENQYVHIMAADPTKPNIIFAGTRGGPFDLYRSPDGGVTWKTQLQGFSSKQRQEVRTIVTDARTPGTIYVGIGSDGVYKSVDYGVTWSAINSGLTSSSVMCLVIHPLDPNRIYAGTHAGVFQSRDGGASWSFMGLERCSVGSLAFSHTHPPRLYATADSLVLSHTRDDTAVFRSSNALYRIEQP